MLEAVRDLLQSLWNRSGKLNGIVFLRRLPRYKVSHTMQVFRFVQDVLFLCPRHPCQDTRIYHLHDPSLPSRPVPNPVELAGRARVRVRGLPGECFFCFHIYNGENSHFEELYMSLHFSFIVRCIGIQHVLYMPGGAMGHLRSQASDSPATQGDPIQGQFSLPWSWALDGLGMLHLGSTWDPKN